MKMKPALLRPITSLLLLISFWFWGGTTVTTTREVTAQDSISQQFRQIAPGIEHLQISRDADTEKDNTGPWLINLLRVDLNHARITFARALDTGLGLETTSSMAARHNAVAAVNGGYFRTTGPYRGESVGVYMLRGKLISETHFDRAAVGLLTANSDRIELVFGHLGFSGELNTRTAKHPINGLNRPRRADELIVFTPEFHRTTLTTPEGVEVIVRRQRVTSIRDRQGSTQIPDDGYVISATGKARDWVNGNLKNGARLTFRVRLIALDSQQQDRWRRVHSIVGGGPQLIRAGAVSITNLKENILPAFVNDLHPRTAIAKLESGKVLLITVDGRQPGISVGMSLEMLANLLREFNAVEALNLDGGGSTTMVVEGKLVNKPSDQTGERPVSDAILIFSRSQH